MDNVRFMPRARLACGVCEAVRMVNLTRIYTRTGDDGSTALGDLSRTRKTDPRLAAYADANEANAALGVAIACGDLPEDVRVVLTRVQNDLFDIGADLSTPLQRTYEYPPLRVKEEWVGELEADCDRYLERLEKLRSFILPGGTPGAAHLHVALTVVRRAERSVWAAVEAYGTEPGESRGAGRGQPGDGDLPQPAVRPAVRARPLRQPARRRRAVGARRRPRGSPRLTRRPTPTSCESPTRRTKPRAAQWWEIRKKSGVRRR